MDSGDKLKPGDPGYQRARLDAQLCCALFCAQAQRLTEQTNKQAVMNGIANAIVNVAHAFGLSVETLETLLRDHADDARHAYAVLDREPGLDDLAHAAPAGRA